MSFVLLALLLAVIGAAIYWTPTPWKDDGDCTRIVQHTIRIPSQLERYMLWRVRQFLREDAGEKSWPSKITLPESKILNNPR